MKPEILPETTVRAQFRQIENFFPITNTFLTFSTNILCSCMCTRGDSQGASSGFGLWAKTLRGQLYLRDKVVSRAGKIAPSCPLGQPITARDSVHLARSRGWSYKTEVRNWLWLNTHAKKTKFCKTDFPLRKLKNCEVQPISTSLAQNMSCVNLFLVSFIFILHIFGRNQTKSNAIYRCKSGVDIASIQKKNIAKWKFQSLRNAG